MKRTGVLIFLCRGLVSKKERKAEAISERGNLLVLSVDHDQGSEPVDGLKLNAKLLPHKILLAHISTHMYVIVFKF